MVGSKLDSQPDSWLDSSLVGGLINYKQLNSRALASYMICWLAGDLSNYLDILISNVMELGLLEKKTTICSSLIVFQYVCFFTRK